jgi:hypothetical protein
VVTEGLPVIQAIQRVKQISYSLRKIMKATAGSLPARLRWKADTAQ